MKDKLGNEIHVGDTVKFERVDGELRYASHGTVTCYSEVTDVGGQSAIVVKQLDREHIPVHIGAQVEVVSSTEARSGGRMKP